MTAKLSARKVSAAIAAHTVATPLNTLSGAALTSAIRRWADSQGAPLPARGAIPANVMFAAANATVDLPHAGAIVVTANDSVAVNPGRGKFTLERAAELAGVTVAEVTGVIVDGELVKLPRRKVAENAPAGPREVIAVVGDTEHVIEVSGHIDPIAVAEAIGVPVTDVAEIDGRAVIVSARLARAPKSGDDTEN